MFVLLKLYHYVYLISVVTFEIKLTTNKLYNIVGSYKKIIIT